jgi:hypothetical protein
MVDFIMGNNSTTKIVTPDTVDQVVVALDQYPFRGKKAAVLTVKTLVAGVVSQDECTALSDRFEAELKGVDKGLHVWVDRAAMRQFFDKQGFSEVGGGLQQAVEAGTYIAADYVFYGEISHTGNRYDFKMALADVHAGKDVASVTDNACADLMELKERGLQRVARRLLRNVIEKSKK